ncbi:hypothetical protein [Sulfuracidifex tepidarius]|uniref:Uncharacterized protein n=1 Tax=Sulfuracidifex tepidarius TaxID=1294262 RepID=A0A510E0A2_9CREN|nr:hypothetical protein [Sulfuracidifex tepidarius]BBG22859.1 hypothetical protein IC006_0143 [Sulfuracidifex tepidarius]BBG25620.1 hypothetical protein IC007_0125 [Sulfuracidifex tepidarius]
MENPQWSRMEIGMRRETLLYAVLISADRTEYTEVEPVAKVGHLLLFVQSFPFAVTARENQGVTKIESSEITFGSFLNLLKGMAYDLIITNESCWIGKMLKAVLDSLKDSEG